MEIKARNGKTYDVHKYGNPYAPSHLWLGAMLHPHVMTTTEKTGLWDDHIGEGTPLDLKNMNIIDIDYVNPREGQESNLSMAELAEVVISIAAQLKVKQIDSIIGVGFGGQVALQTMVTKPDLATKVALVASGARTSPWVLAWQHLWRTLLESGQAETAWELVLLCDEHWQSLKPGLPAWAGDVDPAFGGQYRRVVDLQRRAKALAQTVNVNNFLAVLHAAQGFDAYRHIDQMRENMPLMLITETNTDPLLQEEMQKTVNALTRLGRYRLFIHEQDAFGHLHACRMNKEDATALAKFLTEA